MADQLTEEQIAEFKEAFSLFDKDGDGKYLSCVVSASCRNGFDLCGGEGDTIRRTHRNGAQYETQDIGCSID